MPEDAASRYMRWMRRASGFMAQRGQRRRLANHSVTVLRREQPRHTGRQRTRPARTRFRGDTESGVVFVSSTVKDLVAGSGFLFDDRGAPRYGRNYRSRVMEGYLGRRKRELVTRCYRHTMTAHLIIERDHDGPKLFETFETQEEESSSPRNHWRELPGSSSSIQSTRPRVSAASGTDTPRSPHRFLVAAVWLWER